MDYYPNTVMEATPFIERRAPAGADPLATSATPYLIEERAPSSIVGGFLGQGVSSGRVTYQTVDAGAATHGTPVAPPEVDAPADALTQLAMRRAALIRARNASANPSVELRERLRILNERMNQQSPRVTDAHIRSIEEATALGEDVAARRAARMALLAK
jgi:hypothetical protein